MGVAIRLVRGAAVVLALYGAADRVAAQGTGVDSSRSAQLGVYTAAQAELGETTFKTVCASCHTISQFQGPVFQKAWSGRPLFSLFDQLRSSMPIDNPGALSRNEYLVVIAYILKLNAYPSGITDLPDDDAALKLIRFDTVNARPTHR